MPYTSDQRFLVLHGCKLKGFSEPTAIGTVIGMKPLAVTKILQGLVKEGLAKYLEGGRISGYALTPAGKQEQVRLAEADLVGSGSRTVVQGSYEKFLVLNADLLAVCTAWQVRDLDRNILNDHSDRDYDAGVIKRLADVHLGGDPDHRCAVGRPRSVPPLPAPPATGAGQGEEGQPRVVCQADSRLLSHGLDGAPRRSPLHAPYPTRVGRRLSNQRGDCRPQPSP